MHVIFEAHHEPEVLRLLHREVAVPDYARFDRVVLAHEVERPDRRAYRTDARNSMIVIICADDIARRILHEVSALRERLGRGVRAYVVSAEEVV